MTGRFMASSERSAQLWKSGALAPRYSALRSEGFSPSSPRGLKAFFFSLRNAALKGPLFHGIIGGIACREETDGVSGRVCVPMCCMQ
jgi:hypothetical protein